jgi:hypothetical protein
MAMRCPSFPNQHERGGQAALPSPNRVGLADRWACKDQNVENDGGDILMGTPLADFANSLAPETYDKSKARERRDAIEKRLKGRTTCTGMIESGSWSHGTAVAGTVTWTGWPSIRRMPARPTQAAPWRP